MYICMYMYIFLYICIYTYNVYTPREWVPQTNGEATTKMASSHQHPVIFGVCTGGTTSTYQKQQGGAPLYWPATSADWM